MQGRAVVRPCTAIVGVDYPNAQANRDHVWELSKLTE
jgi:hypothetical protein